MNIFDCWSVDVEICVLAPQIDGVNNSCLPRSWKWILPQVQEFGMATPGILALKYHLCQIISMIGGIDLQMSGRHIVWYEAVRIISNKE